MTKGVGATWEFFDRHLKPVGTNAAETGWNSLFNGKNLDGWIIKCLPKDNDKRSYWKVVDGAITADTPPEGKHNYIWLLTERWHSPFLTHQYSRPLTLWFTPGSGGGALKRSSQVGLVEQTAG